MMMFIFGFFTCWAVIGLVIYLADNHGLITIWKGDVFSILFYGPILWALTIPCILIGAVKAIIYKIKRRKARG